MLTKLNARDRAILAFENKWAALRPGMKQEAIRREFGLSAPRYYQLLNVIIENPDTLIHDAVGVNRLRRIRDERATLRASRQFLDIAI